MIIHCYLAFSVSKRRVASGITAIPEPSSIVIRVVGPRA